MRIKKLRLTGSRQKKLLKILKPKNNVQHLLLFFVSMTIVSLGSLYYGALLQRDSSMGGYRQALYYSLKSNVNIPLNYLRGKLNSNAKKISIDIKHKDLQKIAYNRKLAYKRGGILESDYFPAKITYMGKSYKAGVRLSGKALDHVNSDKWSLRVKLKNDKTMMGMKKFNLLHPKIRNGLYEWFCHKISQYEGLIALRSDYVSVSINGKNKGIYYLEESFDKRLIENNKYREGIIFKPLVPELHIYEKKKVLSVPTLKSSFILLDKLFEDFINGDLPTHKFFDLKKTAKYFAINDLVNGFHQLARENMHWYFNPITSKVEPIGREWGVRPYIPISELSGELINEQFIGDRGIVNQKIFSDELFYLEYIKNLERISNPKFLDDFFKTHKHEIDSNLSLLYSEYPYYHFDKEVFYYNQNFIKNRLSPANPLVMYVQEADSGAINIYARNLTLLPLSIKKIVLDNKEFVIENGQEIGRKAKGKTDLPKKILQFNFNEIDSLDLSKNINVSWCVYGINSAQELSLTMWPYRNDLGIDLIRQTPNYDKFNFIQTDYQNKTINIKKGVWDLHESLFIPKGFDVIMNGGVEINLLNNSSIFSYSPLFWKGDENNLIRIHSSDNSGQGVIVVDAESLSEIDYVVFSNLSNPQSSGWSLTGAVTFYQSNVKISNSWFIGNRCEDALNIIRGTCMIDKSVFKGTFSDAFDGDFIKGQITNSNFISCGNDGIDISGSEFSIKNINFRSIGDKAISVGENSSLKFSDVEIDSANVGLASKDYSIVDGQNLLLENAENGFTVFQKKPEFGPAKISVNNLQTNNINKPYMIEKKSILIIDGNAIESNTENVSDLLYP